MNKFRTVVSVIVMVIAAIVGFFIGASLGDALGGAILFFLNAAATTEIYTLDNRER